MAVDAVKFFVIDADSAFLFFSFFPQENDVSSRAEKKEKRSCAEKIEV